MKACCIIGGLNFDPLKLTFSTLMLLIFKENSKTKSSISEFWLADQIRAQWS